MIDPFQRAEFIAGYTAAFWGGAIDPVRPPAWQQGFEFFSLVGLEIWVVERLLDDGLVGYFEPVPEPDLSLPEFQVFTPPPYRERRPKLWKPKPLVWRDKKGKGRAVFPWLEEIFAIQGSPFDEREKLILRRRFEGYTLVEVGKRFGLKAERIRLIQLHIFGKIRNLMWKKSIVMPELEDVRPRLVMSGR